MSLRTDAISNVLREGSSFRGSPTSMRRLEKALRVLGLTQDEVADIMHQCDYWNVAGAPYEQYQANVRPISQRKERK